MQGSFQIISRGKYFHHGIPVEQKKVPSFCEKKMFPLRWGKVIGMWVVGWSWDFPGKSTGVGCHCYYILLVINRFCPLSQYKRSEEVWVLECWSKKRLSIPTHFRVSGERLVLPLKSRRQDVCSHHTCEQRTQVLAHSTWQEKKRHTDWKGRSSPCL